MQPHSNDQSVCVAQAMCALCLAAMCRHWGETCGKCNGIYWSMSTIGRKIYIFHVARWWRYELWIQCIGTWHRSVNVKPRLHSWTKVIYEMNDDWFTLLYTIFLILGYAVIPQKLSEVGDLKALTYWDMITMSHSILIKYNTLKHAFG